MVYLVCYVKSFISTTNSDLLVEYSITLPYAEEIESHSDDFLCNLIYTHYQHFTDSCGIVNTESCYCVDITVHGIYNHLCTLNLTDIWFENLFLCEQESLSRVSPTI